jgi:hypothetical protein
VNQPEYEALSYTWGDPKDSQHIWLGGFPCKVTRNLEAGLRHLRHQHVVRTLWVDVLCINQEDLDERAWQVHKMRLIYQSAHHVISWLGEPGEGGDTAIEILRELGASVAALKDETLKLDDLDWKDGAEMESILKIQKINWECLWGFLNRSYWERIWIVQELSSCGFLGLKAPRNFKKGIVVCGFNSIEKFTVDLICRFLIDMYRHPMSQLRDDILGFSSVLTTHGWPAAFKMNDALFAVIYSTLRVNSGSFLMHEHLRKTIEFQATDPRDKLYALLGLFDQSSWILVPDYAKSVETVFSDLIGVWIEREGSLDFLLTNRDLKCTEWPSWIPFLSDDSYSVAALWDPDNRQSGL